MGINPTIDPGAHTGDASQSSLARFSYAGYSRCINKLKGVIVFLYLPGEWAVAVSRSEEPCRQSRLEARVWSQPALKEF
jgi:hypothetical protein